MVFVFCTVCLSVHIYFHNKKILNMISFLESAYVVFKYCSTYEICLLEADIDHDVCYNTVRGTIRYLLACCCNIIKVQ